MKGELDKPADVCYNESSEDTREILRDALNAIGKELFGGNRSITYSVYERAKDGTDTSEGDADED